MVVAGAGALFIADAYGSTKEAYLYDAWRMAYLWMAGAMLLGVATTLVVREPDVHARVEDEYQTSDYLRFLLLFALAVFGFLLVRFLTSKDGWGSDLLSSVRIPTYEGIASLNASLAEGTGNKALASTITGTLRLFAAIFVAGLIGYFGMKGGVANRHMVTESYVDPVRDFFRRYGMGLALLLLALVGLYRISDIVLGVISNVFYQDIGFTKTEIASVSKGFGLAMTIAGGFLGGLLAVRYGVMRILFLGALLSMLTNLLFILLTEVGPVLSMLVVVISIDNLSAGLASAAFVAFLSSLTNVSFTAVQYAIFTSLMTLLPKIIGGYSGTIVEATDYTTFFLITTVMGLPVLLLVWLAGRWLDISPPKA
jgi:PAT family beta-lactamase induction signal transducer AmpG